MEQVFQQIETYRKEIENYSISSPQQLEDYRIRFLGTKGIVKNLFGEMRSILPENKKEFGLVLNEFKQFAEARYEALKQSAASDQPSTVNDLDLSLPGNPVEFGSRHPISLVRNRIISIFQRLGFSVADGPEIEDDWHNFTALNLSLIHI